MPLRALLPIAVLLLWPLLACAPRREQGDGSAGPPRPQVLLTGARVRAFSGTELLARGRAARLAFYRDTGVAAADEAWFEILPVPGRSPGLVLAHGPLEIRAAEVRGAASQGRVQASGGVIVQSASGVHAETPEARYDAKAAVVLGDQGIVANKGDTQLTADAFRFNLASEELDFSGNVHTQAGVAAP